VPTQLINPLQSLTSYPNPSSFIQYFFGKSSDLLSDDKAAAAVRRLEGMPQVSVSSNQTPQISVGGQGVKRLFYCGGPQEKRNQPNFK